MHEYYRVFGLLLLLLTGPDFLFTLFLQLYLLFDFDCTPVVCLFLDYDFLDGLDVLDLVSDF